MTSQPTLVPDAARTALPAGRPVGRRSRGGDRRRRRGRLVGVAVALVMSVTGCAADVVVDVVATTSSTAPGSTAGPSTAVAPSAPAPTAPSPAPPGPGTRAAALDVTVDRAVRAHLDTARVGGEMAAATVEWCGDGTGSIDRVAAAWRATMGARQRQLLHGTGPTSELSSMSLVDWPVSEETLDEQLAGGGVLTADAIANGSASTRGLLAIEAVLFDPERAPTGPGDRSCDWLVAATAAVADELDRLVVAWTDGTAGAVAESLRLGGAQPGGVDTQQALDELVRAQVFTVDDLVDALLSGLLGESSMDDVVEGPGGVGAIQVSAALDELAVVHGEDALGSQYAPEVASRVMTTITGARDVLGDDTRLADRSPDDLRALRDAVEEVRTVLRTDVTAALDVQVGFSDNDGDSG